jgi:hypothetical protein
MVTNRGIDYDGMTPQELREWIATHPEDSEARAQVCLRAYGQRPQGTIHSQDPHADIKFERFSQGLFDVSDLEEKPR